MKRILTPVRNLDHVLEQRCGHLQVIDPDNVHAHGLGNEKIIFFMQKEFPSSAASRFSLIIYSGDNQDKITGIGPS
jgi:hypothetical protein